MNYKEFPPCRICCLAKEGARIGQVVEIDKMVENVSPPIVLFIGEAPGRNEVLEGRVFVGGSGELLRKLINDYGLTHHAVITNAILCAPSDFIRQQKEWYLYPAVACGDVLLSVLSEIAPDIIVCLGKGALHQLLRKRKEVALNRKFPLEIPVRTADGTLGKKTVSVFYTHHPAAVFHNPTQRLLSVIQSCFSAVREEVEIIKRQKGLIEEGLDALFRNIEARIVTSNHNEHLQDFASFLAEQQESEGLEKCRVVIDIEVGNPQSVEDFDSKSPESLVVMVGVGNDRYYNAYTFWWTHENGKGEIVADPKTFTALRDLLLDPRYFKIFHNAAFEIMWFLRLWGIYPPPNQWVDTMCLAHSVKETSTSFSLEALAREYLPGLPILQWKKLLPTHNACFVPTKQLASYNQGDIIVTYKLYLALKNAVSQHAYPYSEMIAEFQGRVFNKICILAAHMMESGIPVSLDEAEEIMAQLYKEELMLLNTLKEAAPQVENFNSRQQVVNYLLSIGVDEVKEYRTPKGEISLTKEVIDQLCERRPDVQFLQDLKLYREIQKCRSTFLEKIQLWTDKVSGRIHPNIHVTGTISGRITTSNPPLQNFPSEKKSIGRVIRKIFKPPEGYVFICCDAKQHELRVLAIKSGDPHLREAFLSGEDVHKVNAARILGKKIDEITEEERQIGKKFSFAVVYGATEEGVARIFNLPIEKAREILDAMVRAFPTAVEYLERHRNKILQPPYLVHTWLGRVLHLVAQLPGRKGALNPDSPRVERLRRIAGNYIIQSEASDLWCLIVYEIFQELYKRGWTRGTPHNSPKANLCLTIHDSLILLCKEELLQEVLGIIKRALAKVSILFQHMSPLPFTAEYSVHKKSLGDEPDLVGEWSISEIEEEMKKISHEVKRFKLYIS